MVMQLRSSSRNGDESPSQNSPISVKSFKRGASVVDGPLSDNSPRPLKIAKGGPTEYRYAQVLESPVKKVIPSTMASSTNEPDTMDRTTWQSYHMTTQSKLSYLLYNTVMADIYFVIGKDTSQEEIPAHRFVLAMHSPVFYEMFNGSSPATDKIDLTDCKPEAFHQVLKYMYTEKVEFDSKFVLETFLIAKKYGIAPLEKACLSFILKDVSGHNAFLRLKEAHQIGDAVLVNRCLETIDKQPSVSFQAKEFEDVSLDDLCRVLVRSSLSAPEIVVFRAVMRLVSAFVLHRLDMFFNSRKFFTLSFVDGVSFSVEPKKLPLPTTTKLLRILTGLKQIDVSQIVFFVQGDYRVHVDGFGFERSDVGGVSHQIKVKLKRTSGEVLGSCEKTFMTPADGKPNQLFKAMFPKSVEVTADIVYHIEGTITVTGSEYSYRELSKPVKGVVSLPEYGDVAFCFMRTPTCIRSDREFVSYVVQGGLSRMYFHCS